VLSNILKILYDIIVERQKTYGLLTKVYITSEQARNSKDNEYIFLSIVKSEFDSIHNVLSHKYLVDAYVYAKNENKCFDIAMAFFENILSENYSLVINDVLKINIKHNSVPYMVGKASNGLYCYLIEYEIIH
jgi:hypothetical protein